MEITTMKSPLHGENYNILIINPNSTTSMTDSLSNLLSTTSSPKTTFTYFTNPTTPPSINNEADAALSTENCIPILSKPGYLDQFDGILVACYSDHPLVAWLVGQNMLHARERPSIPVTGIFEASIWASLRIANAQAANHRGEGSFGIVSTGKVWEKLLTDAVEKYFRSSAPSEKLAVRFAGVETTGLNATDLHDAPAEEVRKRMKQATKRLARKPGLAAVCLGCAGMAGMDLMVREALVEELGKEKGAEIEIVDGVKAGVAWMFQEGLTL